MHIQSILLLHPGQEVSVNNNPFDCVGRWSTVLDNGETLHWFVDTEDHVLTVAGEEEELVFFRLVDINPEPQEERVIYEGVEYENSYDDSGYVKDGSGETLLDEDNHITFADYESSEGNILRIVTDEDTGEHLVLLGQVIAEDDVNEW
ncbi:TPA: hypothetical protein DEP34_03485 [Candidatus Uhrbacteria bacterium]|nr:hypothetical protein [Candidatus Uhrbacteria bacterium]HCB19421.1 hypothetical protein [Candidatus Uhrbacteria bacterium]